MFRVEQVQAYVNLSVKVLHHEITEIIAGVVPYEDVGLKLSEFENSLKERFNNSALIAKRNCTIGSREDETVEIFQIKKQQLFMRLQANIPEEVMVSTLTCLVLADYQPFLYMMGTVKDLRETAAHLKRTVRRPAMAIRPADVLRVAATPTFAARIVFRQALTDSPSHRPE
ncbi:hypothetical protein HHI36_004802 [Cryptolaemus montrouzieri]|uniref:Uncharacterized protein n=1 Tax=Cryptolaemus montrouzieri TaxID=559131 RepID=A0ABD2NSE8_9CUCU